MSILKDDKASILRLSVVKQGEFPPAKNLTCVFGPDGGTVGRKNCTWILDDPSYALVLSRKHFEISFRKDHYVVTDHSTNGTFINDSTQKLGKGQEHRIVDGDRILIGEYLLSATLETSASEVPVEPESVTESIGPRTNLDAALGPSIPSFLDESKLENVSDFDNEGPGFAKPPIWADEEGSTDELAPHFVPDSSVSAGKQVDASILDHHMPSPESVESYVHKSKSNEAAERLLDNPPTSYIPGGTEYQRFAEQEVIKNSAKRSGLVPKVEQQNLNENPGTDSSIGAKDPFEKTEDEVDKVTQTLGVQERERGLTQPSIPSTPATPEPRKPPIASGAAGKDETRLFRAFLEGLGIPDLDVPEASQEEYMRMMGEALQHAIHGLIQSLRLRDEFKKEFIVSRTVISPIDNNPLKYSVNVEDALSRAFLKTKSDAYLSIEEAIQKSFEDIAAHHMALVAGMQAAVSGMLDLFSPSELERNMRSVSFMDHVIPQFKHARMWEAYLREYQVIVENAKEDFHELLGEKFTKAYTEQVSALRLAEFGKAGREK